MSRAEANHLARFLSRVRVAQKDGSMASICKAVKHWEKAPECDATDHGRDILRALIGAP